MMRLIGSIGVVLTAACSASADAYVYISIAGEKKIAIYSDNEQGSNVTAFRLNEQIGRLKPFQTSTTLPRGFGKRNSCARLELTRDGKFLYAANRGHDSIAGFAVDQKSGRLTSIGQFSTEPTPQSFSIGRRGRFLFAAGLASGKPAAYRIDSSSGKLKRFATYDIGKRPWWVLVVSRKETVR